MSEKLAEVASMWLPPQHLTWQPPSPSLLPPTAPFSHLSHRCRLCLIGARSSHRTPFPFTPLSSSPPRSKTHPKTPQNSRRNSLPPPFAVAAQPPQPSRNFPLNGWHPSPPSPLRFAGWIAWIDLHTHPEIGGHRRRHGLRSPPHSIAGPSPTLCHLSQPSLTQNNRERTIQPLENPKPAPSTRQL